MRTELFGPPPIVGSQWVTDHLQVVRRAGSEWDCLCPYHEDSSPSFRINVTKGVWFCHTCHVGGTLKKLAADLALPSNFILTETASDLRPMTDPPEPRPESYLTRFRTTKGPGFAYWRSRGFSPESIAAFDLGYDDFTGKVTHPLRNERGEVMGVIRRRIDGGKPKYKYPAGLDVSKFVFGFHERPSKIGQVVITEGALDAMLCWQEGIYAVGMYGSHPHEEQADLLHRLDAEHYVLAFDNDKPGRDGQHVLLDLEPFGGAMVSYVDWPEDINDLGDYVAGRIPSPVQHVLDNWLQPVWEAADLPT